MDFLIRSNVLTGYIEVIISDGEEVDFSVFNHCSSIFLPKSVNKVNKLQRGELEEILVDSENPYLTSEDGVLYNKEKTVLLRYPSKRKTERFVIPDSVEMISDYAFFNCSYLKEVIIPDGVREIGFSVFDHCSSLSSIFLPKSINEVKSLDYNDFEEILVDSENPYLTSEDGVLYNKEKTVLIRYPSKRKTERFVIPDSVEKIGNHAFAECSYLKEVIIPDGIQEMNGSMFYYCSSLLRIFLPKSVSEINVLEWVELEAILVDSENPYLTSEDGVLYNKEKTELIRYPSKRKRKRFVVPDSVEMICGDAFSECLYLKEIIIPDEVTCIGEDAFFNCCSLEKLRIPEKCTYLGEDSLVGCDNLKEIIIPDKCLLSPDMPDDALGVGWGLPEKERLKIKIKYKGGVYNYQTYYDVAPT